MEQLLNKFNSVEDLANAYKNLEKEFTKRSEKVGNLQRQVDALSKELETAKQNSLNSAISSQELTEEQKELIIKDFLKEVTQSKPNAILTGGGEGVRTPSHKPKNLTEANLMAKYLLIGD